MSKYAKLNFLSQLEDGDARVRTGTAVNMTGLLLIQLSKMIRATKPCQAEINQSIQICLNDTLTLLCHFSNLAVLMLNRPEVNSFVDSDVLEKDNDDIGLKIIDILNGFRSESCGSTLKENSVKNMELLPFYQRQAPFCCLQDSGINNPKPMDLLQLPMYLGSQFPNSTSGCGSILPYGGPSNLDTFFSGLNLATIDSVVLQLMINSQLQRFVFNLSNLVAPNDNTVRLLAVWEGQIPQATQIDTTPLIASDVHDEVLLAQSVVEHERFEQLDFKTESRDSFTQCDLHEFEENTGLKAKYEVCSKKVQNVSLVNVSCQTDKTTKDEAVSTCEYFNQYTDNDCSKCDVLESSRPSLKKLFNQWLKLCNAYAGE